MSPIEIYGYFSTSVVLSAFLMKDLKNLRIISIIGSILFIIYGSILGLYPIVVTNSLVGCVNIYKLIKEHKGVKN